MSTDWNETAARLSMAGEAFIARVEANSNFLEPVRGEQARQDDPVLIDRDLLNEEQQRMLGNVFDGLITAFEYAEKILDPAHQDDDFSQLGDQPNTITITDPTVAAIVRQLITGFPNSNDSE